MSLRLNFAQKNPDYRLCEIIRNNPSDVMRRIYEVDPTQIGHVICKGMYDKRGSQVYVTKDVSDELLGATLDSSITHEDIPWLAPTMEFCFEDPDIQTFLVDMSTDDEISGYFKCDYALKTQIPTYPLRMITHTADEGRVAFLCMDAKTLVDAIHADADIPTSPGALPLADAENDTLMAMMALAMLVCLYCRVHRPMLDAKAGKIKGFRPGVNGRPKRPVCRTVSLPAPIYKRDASAAEETKGHTFRGRVATFRKLMHERWKASRGKILYVRGIPDPVTGVVPSQRKKFVIRKFDGFTK